MKKGGDSIRANARKAVGGGAAALMALLLCAASARAGDDSAASAPLYENAADAEPAASAGSAAPENAAIPASASSPVPIPSAPTTETVVVPDSDPEPPYVKRTVGMPQTTTEIPQASPAAGASSGNSDIVNYEGAQNPNVDPQIHSLQEFISEGDNMSPLGIEVREARRKLKSGRAADGLLVVGVAGGSPAAKAGLRPHRQTVRDVLEVASVAAALVFPPAMIAVPIFEQVHIGETYDLIIAVDGSRVTNFLDFEDRMRDVQPGEIVYLSLIRDGNRVQVPVHVPSTIAPPIF